MQTNEREIIIEHALEDKENVNVAIVLDITSAATDLVNRIETLLEKHGDFGDVNIWHWNSLGSVLRKKIIKTSVTNSSDGTFEQNDNANKGEIIIEHALKNKKNLEMTLDIIFAGYELRQRIVKTFLTELKGFICKKLDMSQWDWETGLCDKPFEGNNYHSFGVYIKFEEEPVVISLSGNPTGNNLEIYIAVHTDNKRFHDSMDCLRSMLNEAFPGTRKSDKRWFWWSPSLKKYSNYADWYNKDTLIKMHIETDAVVQDIGKHLLEIIRVAKPEIEKWVKKNSSAQ